MRLGNEKFMASGGSPKAPGFMPGVLFRSVAMSYTSPQRQVGEFSHGRPDEF
jgi:hypothetical protein